MQLQLELQRHAVADPVSAITAVVRPILRGTLYALQHARVERFGGYENIRLDDLAREYRAGDGDCGICFEYAVHDAVRRRDPMVADRIDDVLDRFCRIRGDAPQSILFGAEKSGSQRLIETAKELLTHESMLMSGNRGRPVLLRRHLERAAREFRVQKQPSALPMSIRGLWKADLFLGRAGADRWVATTVKINPTQLEGAPGLRVGVVPAAARSDAPYLDSHRNLVVCPLLHDGDFMEIFYTGWNVVRQLLAADARLPEEVNLPGSAARRVAKELADRRAFPVLEVIEALMPQAQPELLETDAVDAKVVVPDLKAGRSQRLEIGSIVAPISREAE